MKVCWEVEDGYVGGSRPHTTEIDEEEMNEMCDTEAEREQWIDEVIQNDFEQKISFRITRIDK